jgi:uncharacterized membrane protein YeaQ/YmgE (transglycosylase-associated protein family)
VLGAIAGWLASIIMGRSGSQGLLMDIIAGIVGAIVGGWVVGLFGWGPADGLNFYSIIVAVIGAVLVIWVLRLLTPGKRVGPG